MKPKYCAYYVDLLGAAKSSYELKAVDDEQAKVEARYFLNFHPSIQVWQGARYIVRMTREELETRRGH